jgi:hypothetical protein
MMRWNEGASLQLLLSEPIIKNKLRTWKDRLKIRDRVEKV